jgi:NAD(P)-dependent dehydrogenase (short-subunit alcohol dehydrogenase family)
VRRRYTWEFPTWRVGTKTPRCSTRVRDDPERRPILSDGPSARRRCALWRGAPRHTRRRFALDTPSAGVIIGASWAVIYAVAWGRVREGAFRQPLAPANVAYRPWAGELATTVSAVRQIIEWLALPGHDSESASVVVIGSSAARFIASEQPVGYHVAKAALVQLASFYAVSLGPQQIRVNAISSGTIVKDESRQFYAEHPELEALYRRVVPLGRMCTADDIVDVAMFLLSSQASYITGQNIVVDGGVSLVWQESMARGLTALRPARRCEEGPAR